MDSLIVVPDVPAPKRTCSERISFCAAAVIGKNSAIAAANVTDITFIKKYLFGLINYYGCPIDPKFFVLSSDMLCSGATSNIASQPADCPLQREISQPLRNRHERRLPAHKDQFR